MRRRHSRTAAVAVALAAGSLAAFALKPAAGTSTATLAARNPAVEVRTQVIRRTIHVIRHEPGAALRGSRGSSAIVVAGHAQKARARTAASAAHHLPAHASATAAVTRTSGTHASSPAPATSHPVSTRSSGTHAASPAPATSHPVSTRSSGSHSSSPTAASSKPVTRSSGGGGKRGDDGGDGHGSGGDD
jgi:hypothetical protein